MKKITEAINYQIRSNKDTVETDLISDWYHTFWELYKHRIHLFIALCWIYQYAWNDWDWAECIRSWKHFDWTEFKGWFILQLETDQWQISYHLPEQYWDKCWFTKTKDRANEWDWHTSDDVLERLLAI